MDKTYIENRKLGTSHLGGLLLWGSGLGCFSYKYEMRE